jgi:hypothetical protein
MKIKIASALVVAGLSAFAVPSFANDVAAADAQKLYRLKDGGTLYIFKDGKMAQEDRYGRAVYLKKGQVVETVDGQRLSATSNEVARLNDLLIEGHQGSE